MIPNTEIDLQELCWAELALAIFIRACSDFRGRIDRGEGDPRVMQANAKAFLFPETEEWRDSKRFWLRVAGLSDEFFDSFLLPKLLDASAESDASESILINLQSNIHKLRSSPPI